MSTTNLTVGGRSAKVLSISGGRNELLNACACRGHKMQHCVVSRPCSRQAERTTSYSRPPIRKSAGAKGPATCSSGGVSMAGRRGACLSTAYRARPTGSRRRCSRPRAKARSTLPYVTVDFSAAELAGIAEITSLEAPHRSIRRDLARQFARRQAVHEERFGLRLAEAKPGDATACWRRPRPLCSSGPGIRPAKAAASGPNFRAAWCPRSSQWMCRSKSPDGHATVR